MGRHQKIFKRLQASKAKLMDGEIMEKCDRLNKKLILSSKGFEYREKAKKNAFLEPENPEAEFPQKKVHKTLDFRASHNPFSGTEIRGLMRKKRRANDFLYSKMAGEADDEIEEMKKKPKQSQVTKEEILNDLINMRVGKEKKNNNHNPNFIIENNNAKIKKRKWKTQGGKKSRRMVKF